jgi:hypothetical protein
VAVRSRRRQLAFVNQTPARFALVSSETRKWKWIRACRITLDFLSEMTVRRMARRYHISLWTELI